MDLIVLGVLILITVLFFRRFSNVVYIICITDIFLRIIHAICSVINVSIITSFVNKYFPLSVMSMINSHSSGIINTILICIYLFIYIVFLGYIVGTFFRKKK